MQAGLDSRNFNPSAFGALRYTTNKFYRISGGSTQLKGVVPDIILPSTDDYLEGVGERSLDNPLAYDEIPPADYEKLNRVKPYLAELEKRSDSRVAASKDFDYVREDIEQVKKVMAEKNISLNEPQRLSEKAAQEARQRAREQELRSRKFPEEKIYDLTIKDEDVLMKQETNAQLAASSPALVKPEAAPGATNAIADKKAIALAPNNDTPAAADADEAAPEDKVPQVDVNLNEAESILSDYIRLLHTEPPLTAEQKNN
jgi:carboxyl-terminal processing protease